VIDVTTTARIPTDPIVANAITNHIHPSSVT
jgi:hypothetical protein